MSATAHSDGKITQVLGPVVDVEFPPGAIPEMYTALRVSNSSLGDKADNLVLEVAQDRWARPPWAASSMSSESRWTAWVR